MKKMILACVMSIFWMLGTGFALDPAPENPSITDPLLQLLVQKGMITEAQALQVMAQTDQ